MFWFFGPEACGISTPRPGVEPTPPALEGEVLTTGPPGKSPRPFFIFRGGVQVLILSDENGGGGEFRLGA